MQNNCLPLVAWRVPIPWTDLLYVKLIGKLYTRGTQIVSYFLKLKLYMETLLKQVILPSLYIF